MKQILKEIYHRMPFKRQMLSMLKAVWTPPQSIYQHLYFHEPFKVRINEYSGFRLLNGRQIENEIFWQGLTGKWEKESMKLWIKLCEHAEVIIDIGANSGVYALVAEAVNAKASVFAFEPHPVFFAILSRNIDLNNFGIISEQAAVSDFEGHLTISDYSGIEKEITVRSISLDKFIERRNIDKIDLIKIDVEGHEPKVLKGFMRHLSRLKPSFLIEILTDDIANQLNQAFADNQYLYFNINEAGSIRRTEKLEKSDYYNYLICSEATAVKIGLQKFV